MMKFSTRWTLTCLALIFCFSAQSQVQLFIANNYFKQHRFPSAIHFYSEAIKRKPTLEATQKLADCYRFIKDYNRAEFWYEKAVGFSNSPANNLLHYGQMLKINQKYDLAKTVFEKYAATSGVDINYARSLVNSCDSAKIWVDEPEVIKLHNYTEVNSVYSDYGMVKYGDSTYLFTSNRPTVQRKLGVLSKDQELPFYKIVSANVGSNDLVKDIARLDWFKDFDQHLATPSFSKNQDTLFFTAGTFKKKNREKINRLGIFYSVKTANGWSKPKEFPFNNDNYSIAHPCLSEDGTELFFVSDVSGGYGGFDLYSSTLSNGIWSAPANLGGDVNSSQDEFLPTLYNDRLFFSSDGHIGMGGLDIFMATFEGDEWKNTTNLKTPFNSSYDDFGIGFDLNGNFGFLSSNRTGGLGYDDVYRFDYDADLPTENFLEIVVSYEGGASLGEPQTTVEDLATKTNTDPLQIVGRTLYPVTGDDAYQVKVEQDGYLTTIIDTVQVRRLKPNEALTMGTLSPKIMNIFRINAGMSKIKADHSYSLANIYYDYNRASLRQEAKKELDLLAKLLKQNPDLKVQIGSYCDSRGKDAYNLDLSQKRAESVVAYLVSKGIKESRLSSRGFGETRLVNDCDDDTPCTEEQHQQNRRTDFQIVKHGSPK